MRSKLLERLTGADLQMANLGGLGRAYHDLAQFENAMSCYERAVTIAREIDDKRTVGIWLGSLGQTYRSLGQIDSAIELHEEALSIARQIGDRQREGLWLNSLGRFYRLLGQVNRAIKLHNEALTISRHVNDRRGEEVHLGSLGLAYHTMGQEEKAIELYEQALIIARGIGHRVGEATQLAYLGLAYYALGEFEKSIQLYRDALVIAGQVGNRRGASYSRLGLGRSLLAVAKISEARGHFQESYDLNIPQTRHLAAVALGIVLLYQHDPTAAAIFQDAALHCQTMLDKEAGLYGPHYALATALVGSAVCNPRWEQENQGSELLAPALAEYSQALAICTAPGVVGDAIRDLELIRAAGIDGLEPVFELLQSVLADSESKWATTTAESDE
jgi:tetratricopeptide (TPR) repeat protein